MSLSRRALAPVAGANIVAAHTCWQMSKYSKLLSERQHFSSLVRLMRLAKRGLRFSWLAGSFFETQRRRGAERERAFSLALSAPPFLCVSKRNPLTVCHQQAVHAVVCILQMVQRSAMAVGEGQWQ